MTLSQNWKVSFILNDFKKRRRRNVWRCFRLLKRPKRAFIKTFILGVPYWVFLKRFWVKIFEFKLLESFLLIVFCQNRIRNAWQCFKRLNIRTEKRVYKDFHFGVSYLIFPKGLTHNFESKLESFVLIDFCQIE